MGVDGQVPAEFQTTALDKIADLAALTKAQSFELEQDDVGETVVDLDEVDILVLNAGHPKGVWRGKTQADGERVGPRRNIVGRIGVTLGHAREIDRIVLEVSGPFRRGQDHGAGAVGFQAAVEQPERLGHPAGVQIVVHAERAAAHIGFVVQLGVLA